MKTFKVTYYDEDKGLLETIIDGETILGIISCLPLDIMENITSVIQTPEYYDLDGNDP